MNGIFLEGVTKAELFETISSEIQKAIEAAGIDMLISTGEAAKFLECTEATVRNHHKAGKLKNLSPGEHQKWSLREVIRLKRK